MLLEPGREDDGLAHLAEWAAHRETGSVVGDLVEDPAGLAEIDRMEEVAVDDRRRRHAGCREVFVPAGVLGDGRSPRDVVDRARALDVAGARGSFVEADDPTPSFAAQLERGIVAR